MAAINSMRLLVVWASPPLSSRVWPPHCRIAPQPPGPGLPEQAPSVWTTTRPFPRPSVNAVIPCAHNGLVEAQLAIIFERVLRFDQCARRHLKPVDQPGQEETQRRAAAQRRQHRNLAHRELACPYVAMEKGASIGDVV